MCSCKKIHEYFFENRTKSWIIIYHIMAIKINSLEAK